MLSLCLSKWLLMAWENLIMMHRHMSEQSSFSVSEYILKSQFWFRIRFKSLTHFFLIWKVPSGQIFSMQYRLALRCSQSEWNEKINDYLKNIWALENRTNSTCLRCNFQLVIPNFDIFSDCQLTNVKRTRFGTDLSHCLLPW